jgi:type VI secretion system secreted protein VgrG
MLEKSKGPVTLDGPPGIDSLRFRSLRAHEALSSPFRFELEVYSDDPAIDPTKVLGQPIATHLEVSGGELRHFHGLVSEFATAGSVGNYPLYRLTLRPWLWFLTKRFDCRIFQDMSIPDIVKQVFRDANFADFEESLSESYTQKDYVVQYRESDLNFVSRLLEQEGIYYFFKHEEGKHILVLADSQSAHSPASQYKEVPFAPPESNRKRLVEAIERWDVLHDVEPSAIAITDFDFERPTANLMSKRRSSADHALGDFEVYDYPGKYVQSGDGDAYAKVRLEELQATSDRREAESNARGVAVGGLFTLSAHPVEAHNKEYLVVSARYVVRSHGLETNVKDTADQEEIYRASLVAIESSRPFRPARVTRKPVVRGVQTAVVVGQSGEEIWTDNYGRIKVKFPWDRADGADEKSSCWIRVAQVWAGSGFGAIHIPRLGQEVIVDFLEGDPDRPIVTGRVYNGDNAVPYDLPGNQTQSGIKSRSSKGGAASNFNEFRFEDKKGSEQVVFHAEKDHIAVVKNDEMIQINHDRSKTIDNNETVLVKGNRNETVNKNETVHIGATRSKTISSSETITIGTTRTTTIAAAEVIAVGGAQNIDVGAAQITVVGGLRSATVGAADSVSVGGSRSVSVGSNLSTTVGGGSTIDVGKDETLTVKGARSANIGKDDTIEIGKKLTITVADAIVIKTGDATIEMKKNGDITIKGKNLTFEGSGKINVKASSDVVLKGSKVSQN